MKTTRHWWKKSKTIQINGKGELIVKMSTMPKAIYKVNAIPFKISMASFRDRKEKYS